MPDHSLAIPCGKVVAVDIDAEDPARVDALKAITFAHFGPTPLERIGREPRCALLYGVPTGGLVATRRLGDIEILGQGAYIMAYGDHPITGTPYRWIASSPIELRHCDLPLVTPEMVADFAAALKAGNDWTKPSAQFEATGVGGPRSNPGRHPNARARPDTRWVADADGRVIDGRDAFLAAQVYRAFAAGLDNAEAIAASAFRLFEGAADLARPKRDGNRVWCFADALTKARALLASGKPQPPRRASLTPAARSGFWTPATRFAFIRVVEAAGATGRLPPAAVAVSAMMLTYVEGDGAAFASVSTLAGRLGLAPDTVKRARARLIADGYWTAERVRGGRGHLAHYRPVAALLALGLPTAPSNGDQTGHPNNQGGEIHDLSGQASFLIPKKENGGEL